jgi:branched-chain amino acid aminotransferase
MQDIFQNRSFKYGDGLFETLRFIDKKVVFLHQHFERLAIGLKTLKMSSPLGFSPNWIENEINKAISAIQKDGSKQPQIENDQHADLPYWRVRMTFWRESPGLYTPDSNNVAWQIEANPIPEGFFTLNKSGLKVGVYEQIKLSSDLLSPLKTTSALPYVMASIHKKEMGWDDALLLNYHHRIAEATASNIFLCQGNKLFTPSLSEGPVSGILRRLILETAVEIGLEPIETALTTEHFKNADEIWLTNAIHGVRWVESIQLDKGIVYSNKTAAEMIKTLNSFAAKGIKG